RREHHRQRPPTPPPLRHHPPVLLPLAPPLRHPRPGRAPGPLPPAPDQPQRHPHRGGRQIIYLRQHYHFGPARIAMYLKRYHEVQISPSGVWRILKRLELNRLPASQRHKRHDRRWKRYERPLPGHRVQLDVKFIAPLPGSRRKHYQFTAIDDCTRLRVLRIYPQLNQKTAIQFADYVLERLPFRVEGIQTDKGAELQSLFHYH